jgi:hypothetical protein
MVNSVGISIADLKTKRKLAPSAGIRFSELPLKFNDLRDKSSSERVSPPKQEEVLMIKTRLTERLGIEHPIIQAPMAMAAGDQLAAAVSGAGGLGLIGGG